MEHAIYQFENLPAGSPGETGDARADMDGGKRIGVIFNTRSHGNLGREPKVGNRDIVTLVRPETRREIAQTLAEFKQQAIELLVISGGDGTVRDVLTLGQLIFGSDWPQIAILPRGKTNALNVDLGSPRRWRLAEAVEAFRDPDSRRVTRRPLAIHSQDADTPPMLGFILGAGAYALGVEAGQNAHKAGFFNSLAVGVTSAWGILQTIFGSDANPWRRGERMVLREIDTDRAFVRSEHGQAGRRALMLASTLRTMPMGIKLFGRHDGPIRIVMLDHARRRLMAAVPGILAGWHPGWLGKAGLHHLVSAGFTLDLDGPIILDGEPFPAGSYRVELGPELTFVAG